MSMPVSDGMTGPVGASIRTEMSRPDLKGASGTASPQYREYLKQIKRTLMLVRLSRLFLLAVLLGLWELGAALQWVDPMLTSRPSQILISFREMLMNGDILRHTMITAMETVIGIFVSMILGTLIAIVFWLLAILSVMLYSIVNIVGNYLMKKYHFDR